jgi:Zn-dependent peptidase ImmA (M78 family)
VGLGESPVDGASLILLNPAHAMTRRRATLMEEVVHIVLGHPKSSLVIDSRGGIGHRSHDARVEDEAYTVGAACLLPYRDLFSAIRDVHESAGSIAARFGVSVPYVEFRIKRAGLSNVYRKHCSVSEHRYPGRVR